MYLRCILCKIIIKKYIFQVEEDFTAMFDEETSNSFLSKWPQTAAAIIEIAKSSLTDARSKEVLKCLLQPEGQDRDDGDEHEYQPSNG